MVLPVLVLYGADYEGATPFLLGIALGVYGLTQAVFQIPLGLLSDILGRKVVIVFGLILFAVGSVIASYSTSIEGVIVGRALQGSGAIASAIMAMVADLTSEENRTKAMAAIGASIGLSFTLAMIIGPAITSVFGLDGVFMLSGVLALVGIGVLLGIVPSPAKNQKHGDAGAIPRLMTTTASNIHLLRLNWGIFCLHAVLMACFVAVPSILESQAGVSREKHWLVYLPVLLMSFIAMVPLMIFSEKKRKVKSIFIFAIAVLCMSVLSMAGAHLASWLVFVALFIFFVAFNFLEASLPSWVSKVSPPGAKGTAMGIYSTSQFIGAFLGGVVGGWLINEYSYVYLFALCAAILAVWLVVALFMEPPRYLDSLCIDVDVSFSSLDRVLGLKGVEEARHVTEESMLYLKVDKRLFNEKALQDLVSGR